MARTVALTTAMRWIMTIMTMIVGLSSAIRWIMTMIVGLTTVITVGKKKRYKFIRAQLLNKLS